MPPQRIHILSYGRALCGEPGLPHQWPHHHRWVAPSDASMATCRKCRAGWTRQQRQKAKRRATA